MTGCPGAGRGCGDVGVDIGAGEVRRSAVSSPSLSGAKNRGRQRDRGGSRRALISASASPESSWGGGRDRLSGRAVTGLEGSFGGSLELVGREPGMLVSDWSSGAGLRRRQRGERDRTKVKRESKVGGVDGILYVFR